MTPFTAFFPIPLLFASPESGGIGVGVDCIKMGAMVKSSGIVQ